MKPVLILFLGLAFAAVECKLMVYEAKGGDFSTLLYVELFNVTLEGEMGDLTKLDYNATCSVTENDGRDMEISFGEGEDLTKATEVKVKLEFSQTSTGYWTSKAMTVSYKLNDNPSTDVSLTNTFSAVPPISKKFSFACSLGSNTTVSDGKAEPTTGSVLLDRYQVQMYNVADSKFSTEIQCVAWISEGAWMGVVAGVLTITILILSVMMLLNTATPDRFETAKSKCLIIPHEH